MDVIGIFLILIAIGFFAGSYNERKHLQDLHDREYRTRQIKLVNIGAKTRLPDADRAKLFVGSVVISSDYFKTFVAGWMNVFGGRISVFESLVERGRREAILRMKEAAMEWGAHEVVNVRLETAEMGGRDGNGVVSIEIIAYGTGIQ
ncbi:MAG: YbjQ family protein [Leptolyngbyaceae cyanobacterium]